VPTRRDPDEGPSSEDLDRFGEDSPKADARCPDCGAAVWSEADIWPTCYAFLGGEAVPVRRGLFAKHWKAIVVWALIVATLTLAGIPVLQAFLRPR